MPWNAPWPEHIFMMITMLHHKTQYIRDKFEGWALEQRFVIWCFYTETLYWPVSPNLICCILQLQRQNASCPPHTLHPASNSLMWSVKPFELFILPRVSSSQNPSELLFKAGKCVPWLHNGHFCSVGALRDIFRCFQCLHSALIREIQWAQLNGDHFWQSIIFRKTIQFRIYEDEVKRWGQNLNFSFKLLFVFLYHTYRFTLCYNIADVHLMYMVCKC